MKQFTTLLVLTILLTSCKDKQEKFEGQFLSSFSLSTLNSDNEQVDFNIGYTVNIEKTDNQNCIASTKDELNEVIIKPIIRSVVRYYISNLNSLEIEKIDKEDIKLKINEQLSDGNISINSKKLVGCPLSVSMFAITKQK